MVSCDEAAAGGACIVAINKIRGSGGGVRKVRQGGLGPVLNKGVFE